MCQCDQQCDNHDNGSFVFGLILGGVIGAIIAIVIYRHNKGKILTTLQSRFESFFGSFTTETKTPKPSKTNPKKLITEKQEVVLPPQAAKLVIPAPVIKQAKSKLFKKPKK